MAVEREEVAGRQATAIAPTIRATESMSDAAAPAPEVTELARGALLGRYVVLDRLGVGGMGVVYAAYDPELDRKVAVKLLHRQRGSDGAALLREAKAMARLSHPGVIAVHDVGLVGDQIFLAMELIEGVTLRAWLAAERRSWEAIVPVFVQAGEGLVAAHEAGLVHRDFKPDNVLIGDDGRARVLDFGLARTTDQAEAATQSLVRRALPDLLAALASTSSILGRASQGTIDDVTCDGTIVGTPAYMAPEQHLGQAVDARTDVFAFSVALWEALYGQHPFNADTHLNLIYALSKGEVRPPPADRPAPGWLHAILLRGLKARPQDRFPTMAAMLAAIAGARRRRRRTRAWLSGAALSLGLGLGAAWILTQGAAVAPCRDSADQLVGVWDRPAQAAAEAAILGSGVPYAATSWATTREGLGDYTDAWLVMHRETCEATQLRGEQSPELMDLRMMCLRERLREVAALRELLAGADAALVSRAPQAVAALPPLDRCADARALADRTRLPDDLGRRRLVDEIGVRLATVKAHLDAGRLREGLALVPALRERADASEYPPIRAEVALRHGQLLDRNGEASDAELALEEAVFEATAARYDVIAAEAMIELIYTVGIRQARGADGLRWARLAEAAGRRLDPGREREILAAKRLDREGLVHASIGDLGNGRAREEAALAIAEATLGRGSLLAAAIRLNLSTTLADLGALTEAQENLQAAIEILGAELGHDHPHVAVAINNLGALFDSLGDPEEALRQHRRALEIKERTLGRDHPSTANSLSNIAATLIDLGRADEAKGPLARARAIKEAASGPESPRLAEIFGFEAEVAFADGDPEEALRLAERALALARAGEADDHPAMVRVQRIAGQAARALGRPAEASEHLAAALAIHAAHGGEPGPYVDASLARADLLWDDPDERARARALALTLASETRVGHVPLGRRRGRIDAWLADHPAPLPAKLP